MKLIRGASIVCSLVAVGCGPSDRAEAIAKLSGDPTRGKPLFEANCAGCHGADAKSGSAKENLPSKVREDRAAAADTILEGDGPMPSFSRLSDQEIADILAYIATL